MGKPYSPARLRIAACWTLAAATLLPVSAGAQQFTMKFSTQTLNDAQHEFMKVYKTELEQATNGRIQVGVYPASQLGGQQRQTEQLRLGAIEAAIGPGELFSGADSRFGGFALAGLFNDLDHARRAMQIPELRKALADVAMSRGLLLLGINVYDMQTMVFKTPVNNLADMNGRRMRVLATESEQAMIKALGGSPVPMSLPEVLPALQQGTLDGATAVLGVYVAFRYYDVTPNLVDSHLWPVISLSFVSRAFHSRLPPDLQKIVMDTGPKVEAEINKWQVNRLATEMDTWKSKGGKVATFSPADQEEARRRATAAIQPILEKDASLKQFYDLVKATADKVK